MCTTEFECSVRCSVFASEEEVQRTSKIFSDAVVVSPKEENVCISTHIGANKETGRHQNLCALKQSKTINLCAMLISRSLSIISSYLVYIIDCRAEPRCLMTTCA